MVIYRPMGERRTKSEQVRRSAVYGQPYGLYMDSQKQKRQYISGLAVTAGQSLVLSNKSLTDTQSNTLKSLSVK